MPMAILSRNDTKRNETLVSLMLLRPTCVLGIPAVLLTVLHNALAPTRTRLFAVAFCSFALLLFCSFAQLALPIMPT